MAPSMLAFGWVGATACRSSAAAQRHRQDLYQAVENRDEAGVFTAIRQGARWKFADPYGETVLHMAVKKACTEPLEYKKIIKLLEWFLKQKKLKVDERSRAGKTALHLAVRNGMTEVVDYLIGRGADLNVRDERGNWMAHYMVEGEFDRYMKLCRTVASPDELRPYQRENLHFFNWILSKKIKVDCANKNGDTPLQLAIKRNLLHVLPILLEYTEDVKSRDKERKTILHMFIETIKRCDCTEVQMTSKKLAIPTTFYDKTLIIDILKLMLAKGCSVSSVDEHRNTPLHNAAMRDRPEIIDIMLHRFKKVTLCNDNGDTVLHTIIDDCIDHINKRHKKEYVNFVRILLSKGASIEVPNRNGYKPLQLAVMRIHPTILQILKDHGANLKEPYNGGNLLHLLSQKSSKNVSISKFEEVIGLLVSQGCDVNAKDKDGMTPMHLAVKSGRDAVIIGLMKCHANVDARELCSERRLTPLQKAVEINYDYSLDTLVHVGADVNARNSSGQTALHMAMGFKSFIVKTLLRLGAHVDVEDDGKLLPLHYAMRQQNAVALPELMKFGADINDDDTYRELVDLSGTGYVYFYILEHWIKMQTAGLPVSSNYRTHIADDDFFQSFHQKCLEEIEDLKAHQIDERTSLYDLLRMDWNFRCIYTVNKPFKDLIESTILPTKFPKYHVLILSSYHEAVARQPLLEPAKRAWCEFTKITLPDVCIYRILAHLTNRDLRVMVDGLKDRSFRKPCHLLFNTFLKGRCFK